jgi:Uma2 family endonuclease
MSVAQRRQPISAEEYLASEELSLIKHEYVDGSVYAMEDAAVLHNRIATRILTALGARLLGKPCEPFNSDTKVRIQTSGNVRFYYPDAQVVCESNPDDQSWQDRPVLVCGGALEQHATNR